MGKGGMRALKDEKFLLAEYAKLFHIARANAREARNTTRGPSRHSPEPKKSAPAKPTSGAEAKRNAPPPPRRRKGSRRSVRGGTVWMVLKGGFARVPTAADTAQLRRRGVHRGRRSERRRAEALEAAERYVETAWEEAQRAGLLLEDRSGPNGEEGLQYLREQYSVAAGMLQREPVGGHMKRTVEQTSGSASAALSAAVPASQEPAETLHSTCTWAELIAREEVILRRFAPQAAETDADASHMIMQEAAEIGKKYYFDVAEPVAAKDTAGKDATLSQVSGTRDIVPTKCIVRIRNSGKQKHTSILSSIKAVNYFKSNFMQTLRKELCGSKLARGEEATMGNNPQQEGINAGSGKSSKKRH